MRCKSCDYPLWNLKARQCPECGTPFTPSEFEFVVNSVRFCCPHCEQSYYGTGPKGRLIPPDFTCVTCARRVTMDEMVLRPAAGVEEEQTHARQMPWLHRGKRGRVNAWFATVGWAMTMPGQLMKATPLTAPASHAWRFALVTLAIVALAIAAPFLILLALAPAGFAVFLNAAIWLVLTLIFMCLWAPITHGLLMAGGHTSGGIGRTVQAVCYSSGSNVLAAVPCIGMFLAGPWWVVSAMVMVKEGQQVSWPRAALATLAPPLALAGLLFLGFILLLFSTRSMTAQMAAFGSMQMETQAITTAIVANAAANGGAGPAHAAMLVERGLASANLVDWNRGNAEANVPVADTTLDQFAWLPSNRRRATAQAAADALPANVIAHRLGDFVFTYHGMSNRTTSPALWVVIHSPDPNVVGTVPAGMNQGGTTRVGRVDGTVSVLPGPFAMRLGEQNTLRAGLGLPPLPDPATVTHGSPAVGASAVQERGVVGD